MRDKKYWQKKLYQVAIRMAGQEIDLGDKPYRGHYMVVLADQFAQLRNAASELLLLEGADDAKAS